MKVPMLNVFSVNGREKNQKTGYLDPQKSNKKGSIMAYMGSLYGP